MSTTSPPVISCPEQEPRSIDGYPVTWGKDESGRKWFIAHGVVNCYYGVTPKSAAASAAWNEIR